MNAKKLKEKAVEVYSYYYAKSERHHGCFALGDLFDVKVRDAWGDPIPPEKFKQLLEGIK